MIAVYGILNTVSSKFYIGASRNVNQRKNRHFNDLQKGSHHSIKLQRSWDKHGKDKFKFIILEEVENIDDLPKKEEFWIEYYDSYYNGYNARQDVCGLTPTSHNNIWNKGLKFEHLRVKVVSYHIKTGEVEFFEKADDAFKKFGSGIYNIITKEKMKKTGQRFCKNRFWFYEKDFNLEELKIRFDTLNKPHKLKGQKYNEKRRRAISKGRKGIVFSKEHKENISKAKMGYGAKKIKRSDGKIYNSVKEAANDIGLSSPTSLSHHLSGRQKKCKGWTFSYLNKD
jgi:group I intron endonuclease